MKARSGLRMALTPCDTIRSASMSRPESVSSSTASAGSSTAMWKISLRFFSPPEKPSFTERSSIFSSTSRTFDFSFTSAMKSMASSSSRPWCLRLALSAAFRK